MKCFKHGDVDAVGVCKWCGKGLCADCAVDTDGGLACRDSCEEKVKKLSELSSGETELSRKVDTIQTIWAVAFLMAGLLFFFMEGRDYPGLQARIVFAIVFLMFSAFAYFTSRD